MIRFGVIVSVVVAAVGLLIVGAVAGELTLVYGSIGLAALALLLLIVGVAVWREDVFSGSGRREERSLARVGAVAQPGWPASTGRAEDWRERPAAALAAPPGGGPGLAADAREFRTPIGALPERDAPAGRAGRSADVRRTEQLRHAEQLRPADLVGRPGREPDHRERYGREAPLREAPLRDTPLRDTPPREAPPREAPPAERSGREAAADRGAREAASARRPDRVERYPTEAEPERLEPADDPTRLAHRLESLADFGRLASPDAGPAGPPAVPVPATALPTPATAQPAPGEMTDIGSRGPDAPPESGRSRPKAAKTRTDGAVPGNLGTAPARPAVPTGADLRRPPEPTSAAPGGPGFVAAPVTVPAAEAAGAAADEPRATAGAGPAGPAQTGTATTDGGPDSAPAVGLDDEVLVVPGIARYHKAGCILIRFLGDDDLERTPRRDAEAAGCAPCRACRPDQPSATS